MNAFNLIEILTIYYSSAIILTTSMIEKVLFCGSQASEEMVRASYGSDIGKTFVRCVFERFIRVEDIGFLRYRDLRGLYVNKDGTADKLRSL